jgi:branched-subunit amino acid transport protein
VIADALAALNPVGTFPIYQLDQGEPFNLLAPYNLLGAIGYALWLVAYVLVIRKGFKDKTYAIPLIPICLNFTWEFMDSWVLPDEVPFWKWVDRAWFILDVLILYQLFRFGRKEQRIPEIQRHFYPFVCVALLLAFWGQYTFVTTFHDTLGFIAAFIINLVMSVIFPFFYFARRDLHGLSWGAAWCKLFGTGLASIQCVFLFPKIHPLSPVAYSPLSPDSFFYFLFFTIFLFDCVYVGLLWRARRRAAAGGGLPGPTASAA